MSNMRYNIVRCDLDRCYCFNEYNKTVSCANKNIEVEGVREQLVKLSNEAEIYKNDIKNITEPERETENNKYLIWEKWNKVKNICFSILVCLVGGTIICWILGAIWLPMFSILGLLGIVLSIIMLLVFIVTKVGELIYGSFYNKYINRIMDKINVRNAIFEYDAHQYYEMIDSLYLQSLDPAHREMILMHREQTEHNKEMKRLEMKRQMTENERLQEQRKTRQTQERLLEIEEERERRLKGY